MDLKEIENTYLLETFSKREISIERGEGQYLFDSEGKKYLDCMSSIGVMNVGHCNEYVIKNVKEQLEKITHVNPVFYNSTRAKFLKKFNEITPECIVKYFFANSGTEAVEAAKKFAITTTGKEEFISFKRGFHGKTMGSLSFTHNINYREPFLNFLDNKTTFCTYNNIEEFKNSISDKTAGVIIEVVQGNGGVYIVDKKFLEEVRNICTEKNIILIFDEIQSGMGRTGKMFAFEHFNVEPDILLVAKSIAGGLPMSIVCMRNYIKIDKELHSGTFNGGPVVCAAGIGVLDYIKDKNLLKHSEKMGQYLKEKLNTLKSPLINEIRSIGLMTGIELKQKSGKYVKLMQQKGVIATAGGVVIRLLPPLVINKEDIDFLVKVLEGVL
ncbi:MAG TPA: aspartate aminotransferase family protein [Rickettsiales bacterium]|nr:aspartate aminotransferase family protein [Rickettsiales bacterium]